MIDIALATLSSSNTYRTTAHIDCNVLGAKLTFYGENVKEYNKKLNKEVTKVKRIHSNKIKACIQNLKEDLQDTQNQLENIKTWTICFGLIKQYDKKEREELEKGIRILKKQIDFWKKDISTYGSFFNTYNKFVSDNGFILINKNGTDYIFIK